MITTSASSPRARRLGIACGVSPIEGPRTVVTLWPLARSNSGTSVSYAAENPPEIITLISAAPAAPGNRRRPASSECAANDRTRMATLPLNFHDANPAEPPAPWARPMLGSLQRGQDIGETPHDDAQEFSERCRFA